MARITYVKKAQKAQGDCTACHKPIKKGDSYKWVAPRAYKGAPSFKKKRHADCPTWRLSELTSSSALSEAYSAQEVAADDLHDLQLLFDANNSAEDFINDVENVLSTCADGIRAAAEIWRESASNMEDGFGHATYLSDELNEKADTLESSADDLENISFDDPPELEEDDENQESEDLSFSAQLEGWAEGVIKEAQAAIDGIEFP
jgi:hypothetical protein